MSNVGVGQRWARGNWLVGYNTFYDNLLDENLQRAGFGAEAWGEYLRLSANFYQPFAAWHEQTATQEQRMARGYDLTARMRMPFYQHLNTSVSVEQYFGDRVDLFNSGTGYHNPVALSLGLNYTPVPLVTVTAQHKQGESGENQNNLGLNLNYRFGVPLKKQLSAGEVAESQSLRGSRYDNPQRNNLPTLEYRQRKTLTVFLATPPWDLKPGETVPLKLQIRSRYGIRQLIWQGDTQILSLTPGAQANSAEGWTLIMPGTGRTGRASNHWRLSVGWKIQLGSVSPPMRSLANACRTVRCIVKRRTALGTGNQKTRPDAPIPLSTRDLSFIFSMCLTCTFTVLSVISVRRAIILFGKPRAISLRISRLRGLTG